MKAASSSSGADGAADFAARLFVEGSSLLMMFIIVLSILYMYDGKHIVKEQN